MAGQDVRLRDFTLTITKSGEDITDTFTASWPRDSAPNGPLPEEVGNISRSGAYSVNAAIQMFKQMSSEDIIHNGFDIALKPYLDPSHPRSFSKLDTGFFLAILQGYPFLVSEDIHLVQIPLGRGEHSSRLTSASPLELSIASIILDSKMRTRPTNKDLSFSFQQVKNYYRFFEMAHSADIMKELRKQRDERRMWLHVEGQRSRVEVITQLKRNQKVQIYAPKAFDLLKSTTRIQLYKPFSWHVFDSFESERS